MTITYWFWLFGFIGLLVSGGLLLKQPDGDLPHDPCAKGPAFDSPHPFLCDKKIAIRQANIVDLTDIKGVSLSKAKKIKNFLHNRPNGGIDDLLQIKGIGEKTLVKIKSKFY